MKKQTNHSPTNGFFTPRKAVLEILACICGDWERVTTQPGRRFYPGTSKLLPTKTFPLSALKKAKEFALTTGYTRFKIIISEPPIEGSIKYTETCIYENTPKSTP